MSANTNSSDVLLFVSALRAKLTLDSLRSNLVCNDDPLLLSPACEAE